MNRFLIATIAAVVVAPSWAQAQTAASPGWSFNVAPYLWLPQIDGALKYKLPAGVGGTADVTSNPGSYLKGLNFAGMIAGEVRYDRFSVLADVMYINISDGSSHLRSGNFAAVPGNPITAQGYVSASTRLGTGIFSLAGGYTLLQGDWGNLDALAGARVVTVDARTNYSSHVTFTGPRGGTATLFGPEGGLSISRDVWNGIVGVRGRIAIGTSSFFIPYYADIGGGDSNLTWQVAGGIGYRTGLADLSLGWRYLSFEQGSNSPITNLSLNGPYLAASFKF